MTMSSTSYTTVFPQRLHTRVRSLALRFFRILTAIVFRCSNIERNGSPKREGWQLVATVSEAGGWGAGGGRGATNENKWLNVGRGRHHTYRCRCHTYRCRCYGYCTPTFWPSKRYSEPFYKIRPTVGPPDADCGHALPPRIDFEVRGPATPHLESENATQLDCGGWGLHAQVPFPAVFSFFREFRSV